MTREEEIRQYLKERNIPITSLEANSIIEGAEWADKTMIKKACEWLDNNAEDYIVDGELYIGTLMCSFKEAMEE